MRNLRWMSVVATFTILAPAANCADDDDTVTPRPDARDDGTTEGGADADADADADASADADADVDVRPDDGTGPVCGNGTCEAGETTATCPADCATPAGNLSCQMVLACYQCCPEDEACYSACNAAGSTEAQTQAADFFSCLSTNCATQCGTGGSEEACTTCLDTNCSSQVEACDVGAAGTSGCRTMALCLQGCPDLPDNGSGSASTCPTNEAITCLNDCFLAADQHAVDLFLAYSRCVADHCETPCTTGTDTECQNCITANCSSELRACQRDS